MKKSGVVLLATILMLIVIGVLISVSLGLVQRSLDRLNNIRSDGQTIMMIKSAKGILEHYFSSISTTEDFDKMVQYPIEVNDTASDVVFYLSIEPLQSKLNINSIIDLNSSNKIDTSGVFETLTNEYHIKDSHLLIDMIADTIDTDFNERSTGSEIVIENPDYKNGRIESMEQWMSLINIYVSKSGDTTIFKIPWRDILVFEGEKIDFNYVSPLVLHLIFPTLDNDTVYRLTTNRLHPFNNFSELGIEGVISQQNFDIFFCFFNKNNSYLVKSRLSFDIKGVQDTAKFNYNVGKKIVSNVQLHTF